MNNKERSIIYRCMNCLQSVPGRGNSMSVKGTADYHQDIKEAIRLNSLAMTSLLYGDNQAEIHTQELGKFVLSVLKENGLATENFDWVKP
jgi:hypothetical protein